MKKVQNIPAIPENWQTNKATFHPLTSDMKFTNNIPITEPIGSIDCIILR